MRAWTAALVGVVLVMSGTMSAQAAERPNIVLVLSDDQRADTLPEMRHVNADLGEHGVTFSHAHVTTPLCCPSRSSILTGNYAHTTNVWGNKPPLGGFSMFDDGHTIATELQAAGYRTGLFGKYLNGYGEEGDPLYVPPGWDDWHVILSEGKFYNNYALNENGTAVAYGEEPRDYLTDVLFRKTSRFIEDTERPFFAMVTPVAPHADAVPEPEYAGDYDMLPDWRPETYNERRIGDKPEWMQRVEQLTREQRDFTDEFRQDQYETLLSVDDGVHKLVHQLRASGELSNTLFVYTSDNGFYWGEHRLFGKNRPYEEATRVPYVVRWDGHVGIGTLDSLATNIDLAPTFADAAGIRFRADGLSLLSELAGDRGPLRREHVIESAGVRSEIGPWCMLQTRRFVFLHYATGEEEFYDLVDDPLQARNSLPSLPPTLVAGLRDRLRSLCSPLPPGMPAF